MQGPTYVQNNHNCEGRKEKEENGLVILVKTRERRLFAGFRIFVWKTTQDNYNCSDDWIRLVLN